MQSKVLIKMQQIARYRILGKQVAWIAKTVGMSYGGITRILANEEYRKIECSVRDMLTGKMDNEVERQRVHVMRQEWADAVPEAVKGIIEMARQGQDLRARLAACKFMIERDPAAAFPETTTKPEQAISPAKLLGAQLDSDQAIDLMAFGTKPGQA